jgi:hypothetical protein
MAVSISLAITQNSQNIANNTSNVTVSVTAKWTYGSWNATGECTGSITIDGTAYPFTGIKFNTGATTSGSQVIMTKTVNVSHNADGTKTLNCSASFNTYVSSGTVSASGSKALTTIARASSFSVSNASPDMGQSVTFSISRASTAFTHNLTLTWGDTVYEIVENVGTSHTWTIPLALAADLPDSTSSGCIITCITYSGSTEIGRKSLTMTLSVPASVKPSCTFTLDDITGVDDIYGSPVKGLSKIKVTVSATTAYGSPIESYSITVDGVKYSGATVTTAVLRTAGTSRVSVTVTDRRGRTGTNYYDMTVQNYSAPAITALAVQRCNSDGTVNRRGEYVKVTFSAAVSSMSGKNTAAYTLKYKQTGESTYTSVALSALANNFAPANQTYIFAAVPNKSFDVVVQAVDKHNASNPATKSTKVPTAAAIFSWRGFRKSGTTEDGAGIGKVPEKPNTLQVGWETEFEKDVRMVGAHAFYGAQGILDTRDTNETPEWYMTNHGMGVVWEFKTLTVVGFTDPAATYGALQTIIPWKDGSGGLPRQVVYENGIRWTRIASTATSWGAWVSDLLRAYPVGSIYIAYHHTSPASLFGGTWERITNAFLWAVDGSGAIGQTGGAKEVTLTVNQLPAHSHGSVYSQHAEGTKDKAWYSTAGSSVAYGAVETGGGQAHNNMPPYIQVSVWRRTA